jgi:hypothetical protein
MKKKTDCAVKERKITIPEAHKLFKEYFPLRFVDFIDSELTVIFGKPKINIGNFDDWLHKRYGDYENDCLCIKELPVKNYGEGAMKFIAALL